MRANFNTMEKVLVFLWDSGSNGALWDYMVVWTVFMTEELACMGN